MKPVTNNNDVRTRYLPLCAAEHVHVIWLLSDDLDVVAMANILTVHLGVLEKPQWFHSSF